MPDTTSSSVVAIVDYGASNLRSVVKAFESLGITARVVDAARDLGKAQCIVLPGVGAFGDGIAALRQRGFYDELCEQVIHAGKPFLGICLGMQFLAQKGFEHGEHKGLGWIDTTVEKIVVPSSEYRIPHMGWNDLIVRIEDEMFAGLPLNPNFYFVHSFAMTTGQGATPPWVAATCLYGSEVVAAVRKDNVWGVQFHPEKSQKNGLQLLSNFIGFAERWYA